MTVAYLTPLPLVSSSHISLHSHPSLSHVTTQLFRMMLQDGGTALAYAASNNYEAVVQKLIGWGASLDLQNTVRVVDVGVCTSSCVTCTDLHRSHI